MPRTKGRLAVVGGASRHAAQPAGGSGAGSGPGGCAVKQVLQLGEGGMGSRKTGGKMADGECWETKAKN